MLRPGRGSGAGSAVPSSGPHSLLVPIPVSTGGALRLVRRRFAIGRSEGALHRLRQGLGWGVPMFVSFLCLHSIPSTPGICHGLRALGMKISRSHRLCSRKTRAEVITDLLILYYPATPTESHARGGFCLISCTSPCWIWRTISLMQSGLHSGFISPCLI